MVTAADFRLAPARVPADPQMWVSHETIYRFLYIHSRNVFASTVFHELRTDRPIRRPRGKKRSHGRGRIRNMVSVDLRGAAANDRSEPGHLEGDLVFGTRPSAVATLVDRQSRVSHAVALPDGYRAETVADALIAYLGRFPAHLRRSPTWDRGKEMAEPERITAALDMPVYFCARTIRGNEGRTRTRTGCCGSTYARTLTCAVSPKMT